jgi:catechol 2,3-dioxygenase-like lactoylglutathione lyase family enzyme
MKLKKVWSKEKPIFQVRIARPTDKIKELIRFYEDGLGLQRVGYFHHDGYEGVMFGLPGREYHLEFTQHEDGSPCPAPTKENVLVFYYLEKEQKELMVKKLNNMGYLTVPSENPYWDLEGTTIEDPDGWRIVLTNDSGI